MRHYLRWHYLLWHYLRWHYLLWHYLLRHYLLRFGLREVDEGGGEAVGIPLDHDVLPRLGEVAVQHAPGKYSE